MEPYAWKYWVYRGRLQEEPAGGHPTCQVTGTGSPPGPGMKCMNVCTWLTKRALFKNRH